METTTLKTRIEQICQRPTIVVGNLDELQRKQPEVAEFLEHCDRATLCGDLNQEEPAADLARKVSAAGVEQMLIVGGDGTINLVGECALRSNIHLPCFLLPTGTANDLARSISELSLVSQVSAVDPCSLSAQLDQVEPRQDYQSPHADSSSTSDSSLQLDLIEVQLDDSPNKRCCANMFTLGSSARNTQHVTPEIKARWGALAYLTQAWRAMIDIEPLTLRLKVGDAETVTVEDILNVFVANGAYCGGGYHIAPPARLDDELLDVVILRNGTPAELAHLTAVFLAGNHLNHNLIEHFSTRQLLIECPSTAPLTLDGEAFVAQRIHLQVQPAQLNIQLLQAD